MILYVSKPSVKVAPTGNGVSGVGVLTGSTVIFCGDFAFFATIVRTGSGRGDGVGAVSPAAIRSAAFSASNRAISARMSSAGAAAGAGSAKGGSGCGGGVPGRVGSYSNPGCNPPGRGGSCARIPLRIASQARSTLMERIWAGV